MIDFQTLQDLSGGAAEVDSTCPLCSASRKPFNRKKKVLRIWNKEPGFATFNCTHCSCIWIGARQSQRLHQRSRA